MPQPDPPPARIAGTTIPADPGPQGRDAEGYLVRYSDGMDFRVTECCQASAKGTEDGVACRSCYKLIDEATGGQPVPPYTVGGQVTYPGPKARGWGEDPSGPPYAYRVTLTDGA